MASAAVLALVLSGLLANTAPASEGVVVHGPGRQVLPSGAFPGPLPSFEQRTVTERGALEPALTFSADGRLFFTSWVFGEAYPIDERTILYRSDDGGHTWVDSTPSIAGIPINQRGGDPILYRDAVTGRVFYLLYFAGCSHIAWTDDGGETWGAPLQGPVCEPGGVTDYPKLWTSPPRGGTTPSGAPFYVHLCYNALYRLACQRSMDGGLTFVPAPSPDPESAVNFHTQTCWSFHAGWTVTAPDGTIYMPRPYCNDLEVAISRDNGLTWERRIVASYPDAQGTDFGSDARLAMDAAGNLYYLWSGGSWYISDGHRPLLSISRDGGDTWSDPIDVGVPGLTAAKFPSIVAGGEGRIAFLYLGSTVPGGWSASPEDMAGATWDAYVGFSLDALQEQPVFATTTANPLDDPLRIGPCDGRCTPDPTDCIHDCRIGSARIGMYDYLELALDPTTGRVAASLVDLCAGPCGPGEWTFLGAVGVQVSGPSL